MLPLVLLLLVLLFIIFLIFHSHCQRRKRRAPTTCPLSDDSLYAQDIDEKEEKKKPNKNENESDIEVYEKQDVEEDWSCAGIANIITAASKIATVQIQLER